MTTSKLVYQPAPIRINEAAQLLGVNPKTLRRWTKLGLIRSHRHPISRYRLFHLCDLEAVINQIHGQKGTYE